MGRAAKRQAANYRAYSHDPTSSVSQRSANARHRKDGTNACHRIARTENDSVRSANCIEHAGCGMTVFDTAEKDFCYYWKPLFSDEVLLERELSFCCKKT